MSGTILIIFCGGGWGLFSARVTRRDLPIILDQFFTFSPFVASAATRCGCERAGLRLDRLSPCSMEHGLTLKTAVAQRSEASSARSCPCSIVSFTKHVYTTIFPLPSRYCVSLISSSLLPTTSDFAVLICESWPLIRP